MNNFRVGNGFDVHRLVKGRDLILGGTRIDYPLGLDGHSDADVLIHSIIDSLLGATGNGDIGALFPDSQDEYRNISSMKLLETVYHQFFRGPIDIINIDSTIICQEPKISPHVQEMNQNISSCLGGLSTNRIGIKGKTTEGLGTTGRGEGIAVISTALIDIKCGP